MAEMEHISTTTATGEPPIDPPQPTTCEPVIAPPEPTTCEPPIVPPEPTTCEPDIEPPKPTTCEPVIAPPKPTTCEPPIDPPKPTTCEPVIAPPEPTTCQPITTPHQKVICEVLPPTLSAEEINVRSAWKRQKGEGKIPVGQLPPWEGGPVWSLEEDDDDFDSDDDAWCNIPKAQRFMRRRWRRAQHLGKIPRGQLPPWEGGPEWKPKKCLEDSDSDDDAWCSLPEAERKLRRRWRKAQRLGGIPQGQLPPWEGGPEWTPEKEDPDSDDDKWRDLSKAERKVRRRWNRAVRLEEVPQGQLPPWEGGPAWPIRKDDLDLDDEASLSRKERRLRRRWRREKRQGNIPQDRLPPWEGGPEWIPETEDNSDSDDDSGQELPPEEGKQSQRWIRSSRMGDKPEDQLPSEEDGPEEDTDSDDDAWQELPKPERKLRRRWRRAKIRGKISKDQLPPWKGGPEWTPEKEDSDSDDEAWRALPKAERKLRRRWRRAVRQGAVPENQLPPWKGGPEWIPEPEDSDSDNDAWRQLTRAERKLRRRWRRDVRLEKIPADQLPPWKGGPVWNPTEGVEDSDSDDDAWQQLPKAERKLRRRWRKAKRRGKTPEGQLPPWEGGPEWTPEKEDTDSDDDAWVNLSTKDRKLRRRWTRARRLGKIPEGQLPPWKGGPEWVPEPVDTDSDDDGWRQLPKADRKLRRRWKRSLRLGRIPDGQLPPWEGGPEWKPAKRGERYFGLDDEAWRNLPKAERKLRLRWIRALRLGQIPTDQLPPWEGGPEWKPREDETSSDDDEKWAGLSKKERKFRKKWRKAKKKGEIPEGQLPPWEGGPEWKEDDSSSDESDDEKSAGLPKKERKFRKKWRKAKKKGKIPEGQLPPWEGGPEWKEDDSSSDESDKEKSAGLPKKERKFRKKWRKAKKKGKIPEDQLPPWEGGPEWKPEEDSDSDDEKWSELSEEGRKLRKSWRQAMKRGKIPEGQLPPWKGGPKWEPAETEKEGSGLSEQDSAYCLSEKEKAYRQLWQDYRKEGLIPEAQLPPWEGGPKWEPPSSSGWQAAETEGKGTAK